MVIVLLVMLNVGKYQLLVCICRKLMMQLWMVWLMMLFRVLLRMRVSVQLNRCWCLWWCSIQMMKIVVVRFRFRKNQCCQFEVLCRKLKVVLKLWVCMRLKKLVMWWMLFRLNELMMRILVNWLVRMMMVVISSQVVRFVDEDE